MYELRTSSQFKRLHSLAASNPKASVYEGKIVEFYPVVERILSLITRIFPHYTSHGIQHSLAVLHRIDQVLAPTVFKRMTAAELFLMIAAALLHDVGMVLSQDEEDQLDAEQDFKDFCKERLSDRVKVERNSAPYRRHAFKLAKRFTVAEYIRGKHALRSADFVFHLGRYLDPLGSPNSRLIKSLARLCEGHGFDREQLEDDSLFPRQIDIDGEQANLKFVAACIRLGDLLDMDHQRASLLLMKLASPVASGSLGHWTRHHLDDFNVSPTEIRVGKTCHDQTEHRLLQEWAGWLKREIDHTSAMLGRDDRLPMVIPQPKVTIRSDGSYLFREYRFALDEESIFRTLMGERLYGDKTLFLRELIQNAADALRCRAIMEAFDDVSVRAQRTALDVPVEKRREYRIDVSCGQTTRNGRSMRFFEVADNGIGMTEDVIQRFFLKIGRSYYRSSEFLDSYGFRPVSYFGIGFLASFMVSNLVEVETCPLSSPRDAVRLTIEGWRSYFTTEPSDRRGPGTRVRVYVEPDFVLSKPGFTGEKIPVKLEDLVIRRIGTSNADSTENKCTSTTACQSRPPPLAHEPRKSPAASEIMKSRPSFRLARRRFPVPIFSLVRTL